MSGVIAGALFSASRAGWADHCLRANSIPAVLTTLALATRLPGIPEHKTQPLDDAPDDCRALLPTSTQRGNHACADSYNPAEDVRG